jgi:hypothetical protein
MSKVDFKSFLAKTSSKYERVVNRVSEISEEDDWMSSEKIDILIEEIRGLRTDIKTMMNESRNSSYAPVNEASRPKISAHREGMPPQAHQVSNDDGYGFPGGDFDSHVAALC